MDQPTLDGSSAKVDRAAEQLHRLGSEWTSYVNTNPYPGWVEADADTGWHRVYFDFSAPPPPRFAVMVGEIAHDLRSALDHLAWREAIERLGREPTDQEAPRINFPLWGTRRRFLADPTRKFVGKDAWALMERHQPYKRGQGRGPKSLGLLHWFNREDKHRALPITTMSAPNFFTARQIWAQENPSAILRFVEPRLQGGRTVKGRTEVVRLLYATNGQDPQVSVQATPLLQPSFGHLPRRYRGFDLREPIEHVRRVITDFGSLLP